MGQIVAYKCDHTGKIFEDKTKYQSHLRKLARERATKRKIQLQESKVDTWWANAYETEMDIEDFPKFVIDNQKHFWAEAARIDYFDWAKIGKRLSRKKDAPELPVPELLEFTEFSVKWSNRISNTHSRPHNGIMNWDCKGLMPNGSPAPLGYPGWGGRIEWIVKWPKEYDGIYLGSNLFRSNYGTTRVRAYTGTGGGGHMQYNQKYQCYVQRYGYDFKIFAEDWPGMARVLARNQTFEVLTGNRSKSYEGLSSFS